MKLKGMRIRTKVSIIIILSLLIVETIFLFPSLTNRKSKIINEQVNKISLLTDILKGQTDTEYLNTRLPILKKYHITGIEPSDNSVTKTSITNNVLTYEGNNFKVQMNISWINDQVIQYALNIIGITAVIIICVTGMAFLFIARNKTIIRAENAQVLAKELESENQQQYEKLQDIMNSSSEIAETLSSQTSELTDMGISLSENVQQQAASIEEVSASLQDVFSTTDKISEMTSEQVTSMNKAEDMMKTLADTSKLAAEQAGTASEKVSNNLELSKDGEKNLSNVVESMNETKDATEKVKEILVVISDISDRVNLLSLNAAIEAARAGDMGKGFAVVADEIGKLADQTNQSTKDITDLINLEISKVENGMQMVEKLSATIYQIIQNIQKISASLGELVKSSMETDKSSQVMSRIISSIHSMSDEISKSTQEQSIIGKEMSGTLDQISTQIQEVSDNSIFINGFARDVAKHAGNLTDVVSEGKMEKRVIKDIVKI